MKTFKQKGIPPRLLTSGLPYEPSHDEIALRAYLLWERQGRPQNQDVQTWLQAETQLRQSQTPRGVQA